MKFEKSDVIIMARTVMGTDGRCIGAYDIGNKRNIRLLNENGEKQPPSFPYRVGDRIQASYVDLPFNDIRKPHTEDVLLVRHSLKRSYSMNGLSQSIKSNIYVNSGGILNCFSGFLASEKLEGDSHMRGSLCIPPGCRLDHSVCFWEADADLRLSFNSYEKLAYTYKIGERTIKIPFTGDHDPPEEVSKGTIVRLSLARWWRPNNKQQWRCQLQISGSYQ
ncbi:hypothetical protein SAMN04487972_1641 [Paracoccus halophilus]|uniref:Dual OB-containing domain-containing protein n=1 Tax=Paracoccus halophilus TaxID=376733 RepID=A0A1I0UF84_9RHOB|nr:hypothetical protein [Paracoccus halophilus]SFA62711.1 hypothetical protein SAMN04487972_1641 [Paracoccus halophilus]